MPRSHDVRTGSPVRIGGFVPDEQRRWTDAHAARQGGSVRRPSATTEGS